eukprot:CAMPEP_0194540096 /NCGR_PEP_ID=MMETSP0253-20130528/80249_1 /TAXON_ID=2966 /ORGANISM="Noctiluca scintillans" /LENGTH=653 /DNA_ID=CAMNT_0039386439 /DNA_START=9 /DNA_END=1966 /DNA_ORIENTATION=+
MCSAPCVECIEELLTEDKWIFLEDFASSQLRHIAHLQSIIGEVAALRTKLSLRATWSHGTGEGNAEPHTPAVDGACEGRFAAARGTSSFGNSDLSTGSDPVDLICVHSSTSQRARLKTRISGGLKHLTQTNEFKLTTRSQSQMMTVISQSRFGRSLLEKKLFGGWIAQVVESSAFDNVVAILIVLNTILIGVSTHFEFRCVVFGEACSPELNEIVDNCNHFLTVFFASELLLRVGIHGMSFYCGKGWKLNILDTIVVLLSMVEFAVGVGFMYVRMLRLSRLMRTMRVVQTLSVFRQFRTLLIAITESTEGLLWAVVLMSMVMFLFGVAFMQGLSLHAESGTASEQDVYVMQTFFPNLMMTILTLFMSITGGVNWWDILDVLRHCGLFFGMLFVLYIALTVLAVLNIVTGLFVNEALEHAMLDRDVRARIELERRQSDMETLKEIFAKVDVENTGRITLDQFVAYMEIPEVKALFSVMGLDISDAVAFFESLDVDGSQELVVEEFVMGCMELSGNVKALDMASEVRETKKMLDKIVTVSKRLEQRMSALESKLCPAERPRPVLQPRVEEVACVGFPAEPSTVRDIAKRTRGVGQIGANRLDDSVDSDVTVRAPHTALVSRGGKTDEPEPGIAAVAACPQTELLVTSTHGAKFAA